VRACVCACMCMCVHVSMCLCECLCMCILTFAMHRDNDNDYDELGVINHMQNIGSFRHDEHRNDEIKSIWNLATS
jgi:hypothetical protein